MKKSTIILTALALTAVATLALTYTTQHSKRQQESFCGKAGVDFYLGVIHKETLSLMSEVGKCNPINIPGGTMSVYYTKSDFENIRVR